MHRKARLGSGSNVADITAPVLITVLLPCQVKCSLVAPAVLYSRHKKNSDYLLWKCVREDRVSHIKFNKVSNYTFVNYMTTFILNNS